MAITLLKKPGLKKSGNPVVHTQSSAGKTSKTIKPTEAPIDYLTLKQVAGILQVCTKTARKIIEENDIPVRRIGARQQICGIRRRDIDFFMEKDW